MKSSRKTGKRHGRESGSETGKPPVDVCATRADAEKAARGLAPGAAISTVRC